jgi:hypothetical protein
MNHHFLFLVTAAGDDDTKDYYVHHTHPVTLSLSLHDDDMSMTDDDIFEKRLSTPARAKRIRDDSSCFFLE